MPRTPAPRPTEADLARYAQLRRLGYSLYTALLTAVTEEMDDPNDAWAFLSGYRPDGDLTQGHHWWNDAACEFIERAKAGGYTGVWLSAAESGQTTDAAARATLENQRYRLKSREAWAAGARSINDLDLSDDEPPLTGGTHGEPVGG